jgi:hypothetical protein
MDLTKLLDEIYSNKNESDIVNANIGSPGTNVTYDKAQGNRGKQMNPTWPPNQRRPGAPDDEESDDGGEVYGPVGGAD